MENFHPFELLLIDEYAERLKVGKSTIYQWKALGILKPGKHFFQVGKTIRYLWSLDPIMELNSGSLPEIEEETPQIIKPIEKVPCPRKAGINLDY